MAKSPLDIANLMAAAAHMKAQAANQTDENGNPIATPVPGMKKPLTGKQVGAIKAKGKSAGPSVPLPPKAPVKFPPPAGNGG